MASKFIKIKRIVIPFISLVILTSQLAGCAIFNKTEAETALEDNDTVVIEVPVADEENDTDEEPVAEPIIVPEEDLTPEDVGLYEGFEEPPVTVLYSIENDLDGDGAISKQEWETWVAAHPEDTNQDMVLGNEDIEEEEEPEETEPEENGGSTRVEPTQTQPTQTQPTQTQPTQTQPTQTQPSQSETPDEYNESSVGYVDEETKRKSEEWGGEAIDGWGGAIKFDPEDLM